MIASGPTSQPTWMNTVLTELMSPSRRLIRPPGPPVTSSGAPSYGGQLSGVMTISPGER